MTDILKSYGTLVEKLSCDKPDRAENETDDDYKKRRINTRIVMAISLIVNKTVPVICCMCLEYIDDSINCPIQCDKCPRWMHYFCSFRGNSTCPAHECNECRKLGVSAPAVTDYTCCIYASCEKHLTEKNTRRQCKLCKNKNFKKC